MDPRAEEYERLYPNTGVGEAQAVERYERMRFKEQREATGFTGRTRTFVMPEMPWVKEKQP